MYNHNQCVFLSVTKPYSANFAWLVSMLTYSTTDYCNSQYLAVKVLGMLHYTLIPSHCIQVDIERLLFSSAVKLHNFWGPKTDKTVINSSTKMSDFCENCNPHSTYHTTAIGECLVVIEFAETCKLTEFAYIFKDFYRFEKWEFIACSNRQFEHAVWYVKVNCCEDKWAWIFRVM